MQKCKVKIATLFQKVGAEFVPLKIFSEEKLQFVASELEKQARRLSGKTPRCWQFTVDRYALSDCGG